MIKAAALGLRQFPNLNASLQGDHILQHGNVNIGVAVVVEGGLLTVVCKDADRKPLRQIALEVREMANRARLGKVRPDDIEGSTFSVSNLGMFSVESFVAIINPPEAAILAVASANEVPVIENGVVHGDKILLSTLLPLSSYGAYTLISAFATGIGRFTSPFSAAFIPHFVELHAQNRTDQLRQDYLVSTQLLSTMILPLAATMVVFASEIVETLLGRTVDVAHLPLAFAVLVVATILNNLVHLPHGVQLTAGNSMTASHVSVVTVVVYLALILLLTPPLGVLGPALGLLAICLVSFAIMVRVTGRDGMYREGTRSWMWVK